MSEEEIPNITVNLKLMRSDTIETLTIPANIPIDDFRQKVSEKLNIPEDSMRLIYLGRVLKPNKSLSDYNVQNGHTIQVVPNKPPQQNQNEDPPLPNPSPAINPQPQVTVRVIHTVNSNHPVNVTTNPSVYSNLCNIQYILSQLQLSATNLQNTILSGNEEAASTQMNEFLAQALTKQQELTRATESLRVASYTESQQTTTTTSTGPGGTSTTRTANTTDDNTQANIGNQNNQNPQNNLNNPFIPLPVQDTINNILRSLFNPH